MRMCFRVPGIVALAMALATPALGQNLLNVSYDPTRELYADYDAAFVKYLASEIATDRQDPAVARRLGRPGARGDRRSGG